MKRIKSRPPPHTRLHITTLLLLTTLYTCSNANPSQKDPLTKKDPLNRTQLDNYYVRTVSWDMVRPSVNSTTPDDAQSLFTPISLTRDSGPVQLVVDFSQKTSFVGLQKLNGNNMSDIGIPSCGDNNGCKVLSTTPTVASYGGFNYDTVEGEVRVTLDELQSLANNNDFAMKINLMLNKQADAPFQSSYGILGLSPNSDFLDYVSKAFLWENDTIVMKLWANGLLNGYKNDWWDPKYYDGSQLSFNLEANDSRVAKKLSEWMPMEPITETSKNWVIPSTTLKILRDKDGPLTIIDNQRACFYPNLPLTFYFKEPATGMGPYKTMLYAVNQHLCGQDTNCDTETPWRLQGYNLSLELGGQTFNLQPINYMWNDRKIIRPGFAGRNELFEAGGPCEGFDFAIGARFASQYSFNFKIGVKTKTIEFALSQQGGPDDLPPIKSIWIYIWLGGIGVVLYAMVYGFVFRVRKEYKRDPNDSSLTHEPDEEVGYRKARATEIDGLMQSDQ